MTTEMLERPVEDDTILDEKSDPEIDHVACLCSPRLALCGILLSSAVDDDYDEDDEDICQDCKETALEPCPRCGE